MYWQEFPQSLTTWWHLEARRTPSEGEYCLSQFVTLSSDVWCYKNVKNVNQSCVGHVTKCYDTHVLHVAHRWDGEGKEITHEQSVCQK